MSDPRASQNAARLSEDIGDVLSAIRRLIAEDEALAADGAQGARPTAINEDAGDFLARRYGGHSALARRLATTGQAEPSIYRQPAHLAEVVAGARPADDIFEAWPLGQFANDPGAARPVPPVPEIPMPVTPPPGRILRHDVPIEPAGEAAMAQGFVPEACPTAAEPASDEAPLRLDATRRVVSDPGEESSPLIRRRAASGWRSWIRPEPPVKRVTALQIAEPPAEAGPSVAQPASQALSHDGFAEDFDWKARMRPELAPEPPRAAAATEEAAASAISSTPPQSATDDVEPAEVVSFEEILAAQARLEAGDGAGEQIAPVQEEDLSHDHSDDQDAHLPEAAAAAEPDVDVQAIRGLLREMIQEELHGELGARFSRNLRAVIRREVAAAIDDHMDRL